MQLYSNSRYEPGELTHIVADAGSSSAKFEELP